MVEEIGENLFKMSVKEKAEHDLANQRVVFLLAQRYGCQPAEIRWIKGKRGPTKILEVKMSV